MGNILLLDGRDLGITLIEDELIDDYAPRIGAEGVALYLALARLAKKGKNNPTQTELGAIFGWTRPTVRKWLGVLEQYGLITAERQYQANLEIAKTYTLLSVEKNYPSVHVQIGGKNLTTDTTTAIGAENRPNIYVVWERNMTPITPLIAEELNEMVEEADLNFVEECITEAVANNVRTLAYVRKIYNTARMEGRRPGRNIGAHSEDDYWARQGIEVRR